MGRAAGIPGKHQGELVLQQHIQHHQVLDLVLETVSSPTEPTSALAGMPGNF